MGSFIDLLTIRSTSHENIERKGEIACNIQLLLLFHCINVLSPIFTSVVSTMVMWESSQWRGKNIVWSTGEKELHESLDRCTGRRDITEILLKTAVNTIQPTNHFYQTFQFVTVQNLLSDNR